MKYKKIIIGSMMFVSLSAFAQNSQGVGSQEMKVSANVQGGCIVNGEDFRFADNFNGDTGFNGSAFANLTFKCSKGITVDITQNGSVTSMESSSSYNIMGLNGQSGQPPFSYIKYSVKYVNFENTDNINIISVPSHKTIKQNYGSVKIKVNSDDNVVMSLKTELIDVNSINKFRMVMGTYSDNLTYHLTF